MRRQFASKVAKEYSTQYKVSHFFLTESGQGEGTAGPARARTQLTLQYMLSLALLTFSSDVQRNMPTRLRYSGRN